MVAYRRAPPETAADRAAAMGPGAPTTKAPPARRNATWAALMRRAFALDVWVCPRCGGPLRVIATIADPVAVRRILAPASGPSPPPLSPR